MNIKRQLSVLTLAISAVSSVALPSAAFAQPNTQPNTQRFANTVQSFGVEQVRAVRPGNELAFSLTGPVGAQVSLNIAGATAEVPMNEVRPGTYQGTYTIRSRDRLTAASAVTARVFKNGQASSASLSQSLVIGARAPVPLASTEIERFTVDAPARVRPGDELNFSLTGTPGGKARVALAGVANPITLTEVRSGVYEGSYVMRRQDNLRGDLSANAYLVSGKREASQRYERAGDRAEARDGRDGRDARENGGGRDGRYQPVGAACAACGTVESVNLVEVKGDAPNVLGTIAGGLLGGVLGNQVGGGNGKDAATIVGAIGGAYAGNRVQNNMGKTQVYRVVVRLEGGKTQDFDYAADPAVQVGTRVKVDGAALVRL